MECYNDKGCNFGASIHKTYDSEENEMRKFKHGHASAFRSSVS